MPAGTPPSLLARGASGGIMSLVLKISASHSIIQMFHTFITQILCYYITENVQNVITLQTFLANPILTDVALGHFYSLLLEITLHIFIYA